jgi:hypothetical protein
MVCFLRQGFFQRIAFGDAAAVQPVVANGTNHEGFADIRGGAHADVASLQINGVRLHFRPIPQFPCMTTFRVHADLFAMQRARTKGVSFALFIPSIICPALACSESESGLRFCIAGLI